MQQIHFYATALWRKGEPYVIVVVDVYHALGKAMVVPRAAMNYHAIPSFSRATPDQNTEKHPQNLVIMTPRHKTFCARPCNS